MSEKKRFSEAYFNDKSLKVIRLTHKFFVEILSRLMRKIAKVQIMGLDGEKE